MGAVKKIPRPVFYPGRTVWGSVGECVDVGDVIPGDGRMQGVRCYLSERETREILHAWGWPTPERYAELEQLARDLQDEVGVLRALNEELRGQQTVADIVAAEVARQRKSSSTTTAARKTAAGRST